MNSTPQDRTDEATRKSTARKMEFGLAILTYVPQQAPPGVEFRLPTALASLANSGYSGPLFVVDDGSTDARYLNDLRNLPNSISVIQRPEHGGIARAKNTCLRILSDAGVDIGFIAEDDIDFFPGWLEAYVSAHQATGIQHFSWAWDDDPSGQMHKQIHEVRGHQVVSTTLLNGVFLTFTRQVLNTVGGFKVLPAPWGHEHTHWTERIVEAGLAPFFADIVDSNRFVGINSYARNSAVSLADREIFSKQNTAPTQNLLPLFQPLVE